MRLLIILILIQLKFVIRTSTEEIQENIVTAKTWNAIFEPNETTVEMSGFVSGPNIQDVHLLLYGVKKDIIDPQLINDKSYVSLHFTKPRIIRIENYDAIEFTEVSREDGIWETNFQVFGVFFGKCEIYVEILNKQNITERSESFLQIGVVKGKRVVDSVFDYSISAFITLMYVCFGATLDFSTVKGIIQRPVGPIIGFVSQFIFMPLASFGLGLLLFPTTPIYALALFFVGISPGGGGSNVWSLLLGGNLNLSITMTTLSTILAFFNIPLWMVALGPILFEKAHIDSETNIKLIQFAAGLLIPLLIGILLQKYLPKVAKFILKIFKPIAGIFMIFIIILAAVIYWYLFFIFTWEIVVAALALPWSGFLFGWVTSKIFRQETPECITTAIETGIQNTAISMYLLSFSLPPTIADLTKIMPIAVKILAPLPLVAALIFKKCRARYRQRKNQMVLNKDDDSFSALRENAESHKISFFDVLD